MTDKKHLVAYLGLATTGKDYNAQALLKDNWYTKIALADSLRDILWGILGYNPDDTGNIPYNQFKKCNLTAEQRKKIFGFIPFWEDVKITTVRKMLQNTGSVFKKLFGNDYWSNIWYKKVLDSKSSRIVCTDIRFPYEVNKAMSLTRKGFKVDFIWCQYKNANYEYLMRDGHESEALAQFMYKNRDKYGLYDGCIIKHSLLKKIIKDFNIPLS